MRIRYWLALAVFVTMGVTWVTDGNPSFALVMVGVGLLRSWFTAAVAILLCLTAGLGLFAVTAALLAVYTILVLAGDLLQPAPVLRLHRAAASAIEAGPATNSLKGERS